MQYKAILAALLMTQGACTLLLPRLAITPCDPDAPPRCEGEVLLSCDEREEIELREECAQGCDAALWACIQCGDGFISADEECDGGDLALGENIAGDGCDLQCQLEDGFDCFGEPSECNSICGDNIIVGDEACDDGAQNSDTTPDACREDCTLSGCSDGVLDSIESAEDLCYEALSFDTTPNNVNLVALVDEDNDGSLDLLFTEVAADSRISILRGPSFLEETGFLLPSFPLLPIDIQDPALTPQDSNIAVLFAADGGGPGELHWGPIIPVSDNPVGVAFGDLTGDLGTDIAIIHFQHPSEPFNGFLTIIEDQIDAGNGFVQGQTLELEREGLAVDLFDFDQDQDLDILASEVSGKLYLFENQGGVFSLNSAIDLGSSIINFFATDINQDGVDDRLLIEALQDNGIFTINVRALITQLGAAPTVSAPMFSTDVLGFLPEVRGADLDGDDDLDLVALSADGQALQFFLQQDGTFFDAGQHSVGAFINTFALGDVNLDGIVDVVLNAASAPRPTLLRSRP